MIPLSKPYQTGRELTYINEVFNNNELSGNGEFTKKAQELLSKITGSNKILLTHSCTDALEMAAILIDVKPGDEIIVPSYTFSSTANAFLIRGARIIFADSLPNHPNLDISKLGNLITEKTKAVIPVHYAGEAVDMNALMSLAEEHNFFVIEDAAHAIGGTFEGKQLGTIGHFGAFSFHDTKPIVTGEGGALCINDSAFIQRANYIHEKGTNRADFINNKIDKYQWVSEGSSFLPSELMAATLVAQLESIKKIQTKRKALFLHYLYELKDLPKDFILPTIKGNQSHFYILCPNEEIRNDLIMELNAKEIVASFHYQCLHQSPFAIKNIDNKPKELINCESVEKRLLRLPFFVELTKEDVTFICSIIRLYPIIAEQKPF